jgi:hypothetical protein
MARRSVTALLISAMVAVMVGMREATGIAPPPPTLSTEDVVWLSPEPEEDVGFEVVFGDAAPSVPSNQSQQETRSRRGLLARATGFFRGLGRRSG